MSMPPCRDSNDPAIPVSSASPVGDTPLDAALLVTALRRTQAAWRERASTAPERESRVYRQTETDLVAVITAHADQRGVWGAARADLVSALVTALDERNREWKW